MTTTEDRAESLKQTCDYLKRELSKERVKSHNLTMQLNRLRRNILIGRVKTKQDRTDISI